MSNARTFLWLFAYVQIGFIILDLFEHWRSARESTRVPVIPRYRSLIAAVASACLVYFAVQVGLASLFPNIGRIADYATRAAHADAFLIDTRWQIPVFLGAFLTGTFFDYLVHRFLLHGVFWRLHENHHLPSVVSNVMPGIAARPFVVLPNFLINVGSCGAIFAVVSLMGRPQLVATFVHIVPLLLLTFAFIASASHSNFLRRYEVCETLFRALFLITPREHLIHHAANIQGNYGNFTPLWDHAFGTYVPPTNDAIRLGLDYDQDFLGAITAGFLKLPPGVRQRFQIEQVCRIESSHGTDP